MVQKASVVKSGNDISFLVIPIDRGFRGMRYMKTK
jgi:hypothetical protein